MNRMEKLCTLEYIGFYGYAVLIPVLLLTVTLKAIYPDNELFSVLTGVFLTLFVVAIFLYVFSLIFVSNAKCNELNHVDFFKTCNGCNKTGRTFYRNKCTDCGYHDENSKYL